MMATLTGLNAAQLVDHESLKSRVRLFSSPHVFSSKLFRCSASPAPTSSSSSSSAFALQIHWLSFTLSSPILDSASDLAMSLNLFNKLILHINVIVLNETQNQSSIGNSKFQLLPDAKQLLLDDTNPVYFNLIDQTIHQNEIIFSKKNMVESPWSE